MEKSSVVRIAILFIFISIAHGDKEPTTSPPATTTDSSSEISEDDPGYSYVENYFEVPLDHFSFTRKETFKIRYLVNDTWWDRDNNGPIFFYTGNEGSVDSFALNSGFMWDIAEEFGACLVFAEHRFYGSSSPSADIKYKLDAINIRVMGYLTVQQTLADYALLITHLKAEGGGNVPVIAFGGSYGAVLTAWMRMKYPHLVAGGIAASAPFYLQSLPCNTFDATMASVFRAEGGDNCAHAIRKSWDVLNQVGKSVKGRKWLTKSWSLCDPLEKSDDVDTLKAWLEEMYGFLAMANYPYPADFLQDLPGHPVKEFCSNLQSTNVGNEKELMKDLGQAIINVYVNNSGSTPCFDYSDESSYSSSFTSNDENSWSYQSCTELIDPDCDDGVHDFFEPQEWNFTTFSDECYASFRVKPDPNVTDLFFGGTDILAASNIVFSNGLLDPWYPFGVLKNLSSSLVAIIMPDAAHHLDLRASNPADPQSVVDARDLEKRQIRKWIKEYYRNQDKIKTAFADSSA